MSQLPLPYKMEMIVKKQVTITAGTTTTTAIEIPKDTDAALKGYGYSYYTSNTYQLVADQIQFPLRTDQEGSASIPRIFEQSVPIKPGSKVSLTIKNGDSSDHTYDVVFYFYLSKMLPNIAAYQSSGGELIISTGGSAGSAQNVVIYNSSLTTPANVTAKGLYVQDQAAATLNDGTTSTTTVAAIALAATTALIKGVLVQAASTNTDNVIIGSSSSQSMVLRPGDSEFIEIDNLSKVYFKRSGSSNVTVNYHGV